MDWYWASGSILARVQSLQYTLELARLLPDDYLIGMEPIFVPYAGTHPATIDINGHRLVILSQEREQLEDCLELLGGDHVFEVDQTNFETSEEVLQGLAEESKARLVVTPLDVEIPQVLEQLRINLPWPQ